MTRRDFAAMQSGMMRLMCTMCMRMPEIADDRK